MTLDVVNGDNQKVGSVDVADTIFAGPVKTDLKAALTARLKDGAIVVVDELKASETRTKPVAELLKRLGASGRTLVIDVALDPHFEKSARNISGVALVASGRLTARDVMHPARIIATRAAIERLQEVLG
jgi:large subunit ribosomal protein L4